MDQSGSRSAYRGGSPAESHLDDRARRRRRKAEGTVAGGFTEFKFRIPVNDVGGEATIKWGLDIPADGGLLDATADDFDEPWRRGHGEFRAPAGRAGNHRQSQSGHLVELNEAFKVKLSDASIGQISAANGTTSGRILTDDAPRPAAEGVDRDGDTPPSPRAIQGRRNTSSRSAAMRADNFVSAVNWSVAGTGIDASDFEALSGTVVFGDGRNDEANNSEGQGRRGL